MRRLEAVAEVHDALLTTLDATQVLRLVAQRACEIVGADTAAIVVPVGSDDLIVEVAAGQASQAITGRRIPRVGTHAGEVMRTGRTLVVDAEREMQVHGQQTHSPLWAGPPPRSALLIPLRTSSAVRGVLLVAAFGPAGLGLTEASVLGVFAGQAGLAIERAQARDDRMRVSLYEDRERIARDLHDHVIQRLFASGLALQRLADRATQPDVATAIREAVAGIDVGIAQIRALIHELQSRPDGQSFVAAFHGIIADAGQALGFTPTLDAPARPDLVPEHLRDDVLAVLRETLANVVRHAQAHALRVQLHIDDRVILTVADDGVGIGDPTRHSGLVNLTRRAEAHGGVLSIEATHPGTQVRWDVSAASS